MRWNGRDRNFFGTSFGPHWAVLFHGLITQANVGSVGSSISYGSGVTQHDWMVASERRNPAQEMNPLVLSNNAPIGIVVWDEIVGPFEQCSRGYRLDVCSLIATLQATFLERTDSRWYEIEPLVLLNNAHEVIDLMFVVPWPDWENRVVAPFDGLTRFECWFVSTLSMVIPLTWRDTQVVVAWSGESTI